MAKQCKTKKPNFSSYKKGTTNKAVKKGRDQKTAQIAEGKKRAQQLAQSR